ncbi:aminotransferase class V-fold PLP-dependent enzyme [Candidatus Bathyarchaeota archaeon]|nr:aminotransferase class V-fold PLP-dependent enzyme [Candidatus Bathyarchaeota archaeon]
MVRLVQKEETLDPADWNAMRALGHRMIDEIMTYLQEAREHPVFQQIPEEISTKLNEPLPVEPQGAEKACEDFLNNVLRVYQTMNIHPRFWGWVIGTGTPMGMLADMLASGMNHNVEAAYTVPYQIEMKVLDWLKDMLAYPKDACGLLVSGASMANLIGLTVARNTMAKFDMRQEGLQKIQRKMTLYGSEEMHSCIQKSVEMLGLGNEALRRIPVNADYEIDIEKLENEIRKDKDSGYQPFCVVGNAGTVNTGAFDDLDAVAEICARENLWFHVDGAFGAWVALSPDLSHLASGMKKADSLAFDLHKWMYMPYGVGCVLVKRREDQLRTFSLVPEYLRHDEKAPVWFSDYGIELSRGFRALKVWMSIKEHGVKKYGRLIQQNVDQAHYLARLVDRTPMLERTAPVCSNIVCFRYVPSRLDEHSLKELNEKIMYQLAFSGAAVVSSTVIRGKYTLRVAIVNHRTTREDLDFLIREVTRLGSAWGKAR